MIKYASKVKSFNMRCNFIADNEAPIMSWINIDFCQLIVSAIQRNELISKILT